MLLLTILACNNHGALQALNTQEVNCVEPDDLFSKKQMFFRWLVAAPSGEDLVTNPMREVAQNTFFTDTDRITLDSIYFRPGSRIVCAARAVTLDGDEGLETLSEPVTGKSEAKAVFFVINK